FRGRIGDAKLLYANVGNVRMLGVIPRERTDPVRAKELVGIEHLLQHAAQLGVVQDRSQEAAATAGPREIVDESDKLATPVQELEEALRDVRKRCEQLSVVGRGGAQRQQPYHRAHLQTLGVAVWHAQDVVEKSILFIPHADIFTQVHNRRGDP